MVDASPCWRRRIRFHRPPLEWPATDRLEPPVGSRSGNGYHHRHSRSMGDTRPQGQARLEEAGSLTVKKRERGCSSLNKSPQRTRSCRTRGILDIKPVSFLLCHPKGSAPKNIDGSGEFVVNLIELAHPQQKKHIDWIPIESSEMTFTPPSGPIIRASEFPPEGSQSVGRTDGSHVLKALMVVCIAIGSVLLLHSFYWRMADPGGEQIGIDPFPGIPGIGFVGIGALGLLWLSLATRRQKR